MPMAPVTQTEPLWLLSPSSPHCYAHMIHPLSAGSEVTLQHCASHPSTMSHLESPFLVPFTPKLHNSLFHFGWDFLGLL
jgi:hypothetical protein